MKLGLILGLIIACPFLVKGQIPVTGLQAIDSWLDPCHLQYGNSTKTGENKSFFSRLPYLATK